MDAVSERKVLGRIYGNLAVWIPACAGETTLAPSSGGGCWVHPRVRGGDPGYRAIFTGPSGPSPRARGRLTFAVWAQAADRSIPACAGETCGPAGERSRRGVHPRVRGGDELETRQMARGKGPSPRARGRPAHGGCGCCAGRSIPACAGETLRARMQLTCAEVHPRVRGGDFCTRTTAASWTGPSPRARGRLYIISFRFQTTTGQRQHLLRRPNESFFMLCHAALGQH